MVPHTRFNFAGNKLLSGSIPDAVCSVASLEFDCTDTLCGCSCPCDTQGMTYPNDDTDNGNDALTSGVVLDIGNSSTEDISDGDE
jgi:hypothetical protein